MKITINLNHLLIIGTIFLLVNYVLNKRFYEGFSTKEAVENVASIYDKENLKVSNANITKKLDVKGNSTIEGNQTINGNLTADNFKGIIVAWSGNKDKIPSGWVLCDGNNGTPNLTNRFILGSGKKILMIKEVKKNIN